MPGGNVAVSDFCRENAIIYSTVSCAWDKGLVNRASFPNSSAFRIIAKCILKYVSFRKKCKFLFQELEGWEMENLHLEEVRSVKLMSTLTLLFIFLW